MTGTKKGPVLDDISICKVNFVFNIEYLEHFYILQYKKILMGWENLQDLTY